MSKPEQSVSHKIIGNQHARPLVIIKDLFDYYKGREYSLVRLCQKKGCTNVEIAAALQIDPALISRNYPKEGK